MSKIVDEPEAYFSQFALKDDPLLQELQMEAETVAYARLRAGTLHGRAVITPHG